ncbi:MAG: TatD family nuclease-associated radical SAM protein, partial [Planctomycetota bacterium]|nr:TatD family nuclease-associated radical SAM protein [Planctomycetota bacterium]
GRNGITGPHKIKGVSHCFSASKEIAREYLNLGMFISVAGPITYPNAGKLRETVKESIPVESLLLETDCPFLAPQAKRGTRNEPSYLVYHLSELAKLYGLSPEDVARITTLNARSLFQLSVPEVTHWVRPASGGDVSDKTDLSAVPTGQAGKKTQTIAYPIRDSLYLNITNRCTCQCSFCVTHYSDYVKGHNLRLLSEPTVEEVISSIPSDVNVRYREVVFCGYGEPTLRLDVIKEVSNYLKKKNITVRLNTNGHGNLIANRSIVKELKGLIDKVSVSLNALGTEEYQEVCQSQFGKIAFDKVVEFIREAKENLPYVEITTVARQGVDINKFWKFAGELGVDFRARIYNEVG